MDFTPYILVFSAICGVLCYGLLRRPSWMWYVGWFFFYLFAAYFGNFFFSALYHARNQDEIGFACTYLVGGMVLWLPAVIWWAKSRKIFGQGTGKKPVPAARDSSLS